MSIKHHPSDAALAAFAGGSLDEPSRLVVATHLRLCQSCRAKVRMLETAGGVLLQEAQAVALPPDSLEAALGRLDDPSDARPADAVAVPAKEELPETILPLLIGYRLGPWRKLGLGLKMRFIETESRESRVFMLEAEPGITLPRHRHSGREWTCVLQGAFRHQHGRFGAGDFDEADATVEHHPSVETGERCICIVAMQGGIELQGWFGRLLQPLVRF